MAIEPTESAHLLVRRGTADWRPPTEREFSVESELRDLLAAHPALLPGLDDPVAVTELQIPGVGSVDVVAIDREGRIAVVECKLASNSEIRRSVVGQVLAYAAGLWTLGIDEFERSWRARSEGATPSEALSIDRDADAKGADVREALADTLSHGRFVLVLAVDAITPELRRIVEYLNAHTLAEVSVLALELTYARESDVEILIPKVFGVELAQSPQRSASRRVWTADDVIVALADHGDPAAEAGRRLFEHAHVHNAATYLGTGVSPSVTVNFRTPDGSVFRPWSIYTGDTPVVAANFDWTRPLPRSVRERFVRDIADIPGSNVDPADVLARDFRRRPSVPVIGCLDESGCLEMFIHAVDRLLGATRELRGTA